MWGLNCDGSISYRMPEFSIFLVFFIFIFFLIWSHKFFIFAMPCGMWDLSSPSTGGAQPLGTDVQSLNHQTTRELPLWYSLSSCTWCR